MSEARRGADIGGGELEGLVKIKRLENLLFESVPAPLGDPTPLFARQDGEGELSGAGAAITPAESRWRKRVKIETGIQGRSVHRHFHSASPIMECSPADILMVFGWVIIWRNHGERGKEIPGSIVLFPEGKGKVFDEFFRKSS